ncbi:hypothetical protein M501DRAFT_997479 [Patellaria atrata CBS 101060]|uniref:Uncharacterized protein n=1 Tax=Patellaria atrata CBS 101060 TaxID=1346257 RepID=A0A9P4S4R2_9PEZI|nr:hypothetical protein M501DRAFT_997479 [Patellaria atrata CBS 101060]
MELAGEWMLQACLEAYLVFRSADPKLAAEVFAWGHRGATSSSPAPDAGTDEAAVNAMFAADPEDGGGELPAWTQAKQEWADKLHPTEGVGLGVHLENLMKEYPIQVFESTVVELLEGLGESLSVPIMVQLEEGVVEGLTEQEVRELRERVGY